MKGLLISLVLLVGLAGAARAGAAVPEVAIKTEPERVEKIHFFGRLDSWQAVDADTLIVWVTPFRPYLIELAQRSPDLRFAQTIGLTSSAGGHVYASFDSVQVRGWRYPIREIYKLSRDEARDWRAWAS